jgi:hypothetical protein
MTQKEMARLINRSPVTIQKIELCKLPLTESLGLEIGMRTGVDFDWLMKNDTNAPIIDANGKPYTREMFERMQSLNPKDPRLLFDAYFDLPRIIAMCVINIARGALVAQAANEVGALNLFGYRITKAIGDVVERMDGYEDLLKKWADQLDKAMRSPDSANDCNRLVQDVLRDCGHTSNKILEAKVGRPFPRRTTSSKSTPARSSRKHRPAP